MNDHPPCLVNRMGKTASENEDVHSSLYFCHHQASDWSEPFLVFLLLPSNCPFELFIPSSIVVQSEGISEGCAVTRTNVGEGGRQIISLENLFVYEITVVGTHESLCFPALLKESLVGVVEFNNMATEGTLPEVKKVPDGPALREK